MVHGNLMVYRLNGRSSGIFKRERKDYILNENKEYVRFLEEIREHVEAKYEGRVKGEVCTSVKNNGVTVTGLMLKGEQETVAPNFYLDQQFVEWIRGLRTTEEIVDRLCTAYEREVQANSHLVSSIRFSWEEFRRNVFMRLVNREKNQELLESIPYREFLDMAVIYYYSVPISEGVMGTMIITEEHRKLLEVTAEELYEAAKSNCERFQPVRVRCMEDVLYELGRRLGVEVMEANSRYPFLYILTNTKGIFGAVSMTYPEELECFSNRIGKSFYVLPSSIHEVILVPDNKDICVEYLAHMVREINETQVDPTEVLSNSIYYYDIGLKSIRRIA